jgi:lipopolysaccharide export system protein LptA
MQTWKSGFSAGNTPIFYNALTLPVDTSKPIVPVATTLPTANKTNEDTTTLPTMDSTLFQNKVDTFNLKISKDSLEAPLKYEAEDSAVILVANKKVLLYGKTKTTYKDITLQAPKVEVDQQTQLVTAVNAKDSTGEVIETAQFKSGETAFTSDTIQYNFKTQIGLTKNTFTQQEEIVVNGEVIKKVNENTTLAKSWPYQVRPIRSLKACRYPFIFLLVFTP